jgi:hypothetical protein
LTNLAEKLHKTLLGNRGMNATNEDRPAHGVVTIKIYSVVVTPRSGKTLLGIECFDAIRIMSSIRLRRGVRSRSKSHVSAI